MIGTTGYKLNPEKLASARRELLPYLFSNFYYTEDFEYFDLIKPYLDLPEPRKSIEEISQELDEKIDALIKTTKWKFAYSKEGAEKTYNAKFDKIFENFEYAKKNGEFIPKLTFGYGIGLSAASYAETSFVIKQGNKHEGYYTIGNQRFLKYYMPDKPNRFVRFFMKTCLGFYWVDETT
jgi:hypothetical protein